MLGQSQDVSGGCRARARLRDPRTGRELRVAVQEAVRRDRVDSEHRQLERVAVEVDRHGVTFVEDRLLAPGGLLEGRDDQHPRPDPRPVHAVADGDHATDTFRAQRSGQLRAHPIDAPDQVQIRWVDRRRLDRNGQLTGAGIPRINLDELDDVGWCAEARQLKGLHRNRAPMFLAMIDCLDGSAPAVDSDGGAGDVARSRGGEERDHLGDLFGLAARCIGVVSPSALMNSRPEGVGV